VFEADCTPIPLGEILDSSADMAEAYRRFDAIYRNTDFCIQKTADDFAVIVADYEIDGRPVKTNIAGAACLLDSDPLLKIFAANTAVANKALAAIAASRSELYRNLFPKHRPVMNLMLE
jgi:hypothetical protein